MWLIGILAIAQVVGCFVADGILTYEPSLSSDFTEDLQISEETSNGWQSILRSAMYRTLIKYTGFSPSLDFKMEADTLLWEKLNAAKYTRKVPKPDDDETLKTGVLIDLSRENGHLEFRQVDKSLYTLEPKDHRLLALWRMKLIQGNHYIIQIKIPEEPPREHFYEYSQAGGLKETNLKNIDYNKSKQNKNGAWKVRQRKAYATPTDAYTNVNTYTKRPDHYVVSNHQYNGNRYKIPQQTYRNGKTARTYLYKPTTQYYTVVGFQSPPPVQKFSGWNEYSYQPNNQVKDYTEFKQQAEYDGFLPSLGPASNPSLGAASNPLLGAASNPLLGPASNPSLYQESSSNEAVTYKQPTNYFPQYTPEPIPPTPSPYPLTYFKPSAQFVQYSEVDPFYNTENSSYNTYGVINTAAAGLSLLGQYPLYYNTLPTAAISVQVPSVQPGNSLYDIAINSLRNNSSPSIKESFPENTAQPTATSITFDYSSEIGFKNAEHTTVLPQETTIEVLKPTITEISQPRPRVKNSLRNPARTSNSGGENYEYAPLYIRWGEKIKPSEKIKSTTPKIRTTEKPTTIKIRTTEKPTTLRTTTTKPITEQPLEKKTIKNVTLVEGNTGTKGNASETNVRNVTAILKPSERLQELQKRRLSFKSRKQEKQKQEDIIDKKEKPAQDNVYSTTNKSITLTRIEEGTSYYTSNITGKSPEEVVRDYTSLGLKNSTSIEKSENLRSANAKNNAKEHQNKDNDSQNEGSEPVSVIVNRISQSFSYKTSDGESGNIRQVVKNP